MFNNGDQVNFTAQFLNDTNKAINHAKAYDLSIKSVAKKQTKRKISVSYSGYFQVEIDSKNNTFSVQHGENIPAFLQINRSVQSIPTVQNMAIIANYLILEITALDAESFNFEYKIIDSINFEEDKVKIIIGRFYSENDKWVFERHYYGGFAQFLTLGGCDGE
ncbi:hypothetical protein AAEX28_02465 [Lentisphaerota bacterium WC36G]|nr:hypothetical protein LJT99_05350 [Lentisphaerae bacterium WC36]